VQSAIVLNITTATSSLRRTSSRRGRQSSQKNTVNVRQSVALGVKIALAPQTIDKVQLPRQLRPQCQRAAKSILNRQGRKLGF